MADWRLQGQERFLKGVALQFRPYEQWREGWDHDHCEFCGAKFSLSQNDIRAGYTTADMYHWICESCFADFKDMFEWTLVHDEH